MTTVIVFFHMATTVTNETDLWQAGKYPPPTMPVQNARQLTGEKTLKHYQKTATTNTHAFIRSTIIFQAGQRETEKQKKETKKSKRQREILDSYINPINQSSSLL